MPLTAAGAAGAKTVRWAEAAEEKAADTDGGEVATVSFCDDPSQIRLKCVQELKEARAQAAQHGRVARTLLTKS
jgi:hypothetical protein